MEVAKVHLSIEELKNLIQAGQEAGTDTSQLEALLAEVDTDDKNAYNLFTMGKSPSPQRRRWVTLPGVIERLPEAFSIKAEKDAAGNIKGFTIEDPDGSVIRSRSALVAKIHSEFPEINLSTLEDAHISYYDYSAEVML